MTKTIKPMKRTAFTALAILILAITLTAFLFTACSSEKATKAVYQKITAEEAKQKMDSGESYVLVDVRTEDEFKVGHIEGALLIPNDTLLADPPMLLPDKDATILIYCRSGNRSRQASEKLIEMGYTKVYDFGGIIDWPYDTVK